MAPNIISRCASRFLPLLAVATLATVVGCTGSPIGDPCIPESIPEGGFDPREIYLETSSVQCRTRVCMVYRLSGDPENVCDATGNPAGCISQTTLNNQVYCSCRCSVGEGGEANTPLCACGDGFTCQDDVVTTGGVGVTGGYCVPCIRPGDDRELDATVYEECPTG